jgi:hypothetical protein
MFWYVLIRFYAIRGHADIGKVQVSLSSARAQLELVKSRSEIWKFAVRGWCWRATLSATLWSFKFNSLLWLLWKPWPVIDDKFDDLRNSKMVIFQFAIHIIYHYINFTKQNWDFKQPNLAFCQITSNYHKTIQTWWSFTNKASDLQLRP